MKKHSTQVKLILAMIACLLLSSCSKRDAKNLGIKFIDDSNLYSQTFKVSITNGRFQFPSGIPVLIKTIDSIPDSQIGLLATSELDEESNWSNWNEYKNAKKNCLLIVVSRKPQLVQIRFGKNLSLESYKAGLSLGTKYRQMQDTFLLRGFENGLIAVLENLEKELPPALELSWLMKIEKPGAQAVFNELSALTTPSDNTYTTFIFKPYSNIITSLKLFSHPVLLVIFNALLLMLFVKCGQFLIRIIFSKGKVKSVLMFIWNVCASIFFSVPFWGSIIFLSSFRMEDILFAKYLEIPLPPLTIYSDWFSSYTQIWLAIIIGVLVLAVDFASIYLSAIVISSLVNSTREEIEKDMQDNMDEIFSNAAGRAFSFAIFSLFMPRAISLLVLFYYVLKIPSAILNYIKLVKLNI